MKNRKEQILQKALELYLERGYAGVSISVIQNEMGIGRATMYYYFKDKDELFRTVIERFYIETQRKSLDLAEDILLSELIESRKQLLEQTHSFFTNLRSTAVSAANLQSLMYFGAIRFPEIGEQIADLKRQEFKLWKRAVKNSVLRGEIRQDVEVDKLAYIFASVKEVSDYSLLVNSDYEKRFIASMEYAFDMVRNR